MSGDGVLAALRTSCAMTPGRALWYARLVREVQCCVRARLVFPNPPRQSPFFPPLPRIWLSPFRSASPPPLAGSVVRVLIDVAFAFLYFLSGVKGWLANSLDLANDPISSNPWFQNLLVPLLMVAPLWWRFQQNLRRSYETRQR